MKKIIKTLLVVMVLAVVLTAFTGCDVKGALNGIIPPELTCTILGHKGGEATCLQGAECERCGAEYGELGEHGEAYKGAVNPTCEESGLTVGMYCPLCGETIHEQTVVPAKGHTSVEYAKVEPTCQRPGKEAGTVCETCGKNLTGGAEIPVIDCTYGEDHRCTMCDQLDPSVCLHENMTETVVAPTCGADGYTRHDCDDCEYYYDTDPTTATGNHTWDAGVVTTAPGCETTGVRTHTCTVCGGTKTEDEPAAGHNFLYAGGACSVCLLNGVSTIDPDFKANAVFADMVNKVVVDNHHLVDFTGHGFPYQFTYLTVLTEGTYTFVSDRPIGFTIFVNPVMSLDGTPNPDYTFVPGQLDTWGPYEAGLNADNTINHIHLKPGVYYIGMIYFGGVDYNAAVGEYNVTILHDHVLTDVDKVDATCTNDGYTAHKACYCGYTEGKEVIPAGHTNGNPVEENRVEATCQTTGSYDSVINCAVCGKELSREAKTIAKLAHAYENGYCTILVNGEACGAVDPNYYFTVTIPEALAAADGKKVKVSGTVSTINTVWSETHGNISVTIVDADGNELYLYRLKTNVALGDIITVQGTMATYNSNRQIAAGATAEITGHDSSYDYKEMSIVDAIAAADNTNVIVTGTVVKINTAYSSSNNNISVTIADDNGTQLYLYRLTGNVEVGQIIKVKGSMATYNGSRQVTGGTFEAAGTHTCSKWTEATCKDRAACVVCGKETGELATTHNYENGICTICTGVDPDFEGEVVAPTTVTVTIEDYKDEKNWVNGTQYGSLTMDENITVTASGTDANTGKYYDAGYEWRMYQTGSPSITVKAAEGKKILSVKITYNTRNTGVLTQGTTKITSGTVVNVDANSITFSVGNTSTATNGQVKITAIEVIYQ